MIERNKQRFAATLKRVAEEKSTKINVGLLSDSSSDSSELSDSDSESESEDENEVTKESLKQLRKMDLATAFADPSILQTVLMGIVAMAQNGGVGAKASSNLAPPFFCS